MFDLVVTRPLDDGDGIIGVTWDTPTLAVSGEWIDGARCGCSLADEAGAHFVQVTTVAASGRVDSSMVEVVLT